MFYDVSVHVNFHSEMPWTIVTEQRIQRVCELSNGQEFDKLVH